jgi:hypothetical protein
MVPAVGLWGMSIHGYASTRGLQAPASSSKRAGSVAPQRAAIGSAADYFGVPEFEGGFDIIWPYPLPIIPPPMPIPMPMAVRQP